MDKLYERGKQNKMIDKAPRWKNWGYRVVSQMVKNEVEMDSESAGCWRKAVIVPVYKGKTSINACNNLRGRRKSYRHSMLGVR